MNQEAAALARPCGGPPRAPLGVPCPSSASHLHHRLSNSLSWQKACEPNLGCLCLSLKVGWSSATHICAPLSTDTARAELST